jgi:hypothetical protein
VNARVDPLESIEHHLGSAVYSLEAAVDQLVNLAKHSPELVNDYDRLSAAHIHLGNLIDHLGRCT